MKQITVTNFKKHFDEILNCLEEEIVVTRRGKPIAKIMSVHPPSYTLLGAMKGKIKINDDAFSTGLEWRTRIRPASD